MMPFFFRKLRHQLAESELLLSMFGAGYEKKDSRVLDSLLYGLLTTPKYDFSSSTLDEALNTGRVSIIKSDSVRALLYDIPRIMIKIRNSEEQLYRDIENNLTPYLYEEISFRQMDEGFSGNSHQIGSSKLKHKDNRVVLSKLKFENMVDNKYYLLGSLLMTYEDLKGSFKTMTRLLEDEMNKNG